MRVEFTALSEPLVFPVLQTESLEVRRLDTNTRAHKTAKR